MAHRLVALTKVEEAWEQARGTPTRWEVRKLPWDEKKPWFAYHPQRPLIRTETWAAAMARVCEELREKQG